MDQHHRRAVALHPVSDGRAADLHRADLHRADLHRACLCLRVGGLGRGNQEGQPGKRRDSKKQIDLLRNCQLGSSWL